MPVLSARVLYPFAGKEHPRNDATKTEWRGGGLFTCDLTDAQFLRISSKYQLGRDSSQSDIDRAIDEYPGAGLRQAGES